MITVNSVSGGKTSAYVMKHFPADYNIFQLVRLNTKKCLWMKGKDELTRKLISDRIGMEFIGTAEDDTCIYTILDLEQHLGSEIKIITSHLSFEELIDEHKNRLLPSPIRRYCTTELKIDPTFRWWQENFDNEIVEMRIGYRANEIGRVNKMLKRCDNNRILSFKHIAGTKITKKGIQNVWDETKWQRPVFPLVEWQPTWNDGIIKHWTEDGRVRFSEKNNCVFCVNAEILWLAYMWEVCPEKMEVASSWEVDRKYNNDTLKADGNITYEKIKHMSIP